MVQSAVARRHRPATPADLHRLAAQAHAKGVTLLQECLTGAWFATSASRPGQIHRLTGFSELTELQAPEEMALYKQIRSAVLRELPILNRVPADHPWVKLDEAALALWCASWMAGVAAGAAYENLRRTLVGPRRVCPQCWGVGTAGPRRSDRDPDAGGTEVCPTCAGNGTVATPVPRLDLRAT